MLSLDGGGERLSREAKVVRRVCQRGGVGLTTPPLGAGVGNPARRPSIARRLRPEGVSGLRREALSSRS